MPEEVFNFCCQNPECQASNTINKKRFLDALASRLNVILICGNCGVTSKPPSLTDEPTDFLKCIPFENVIPRHPPRRDLEGWRDDNNRSLSRREYLDKYGVDPQINYDWRKRGKLKPAKQC